MRRLSHAVDHVRVSFDEANLVANAGLLLVGTLVARLQLERLVNAAVRLSGRVGGARPGRKVLTLLHAMVAGASHIDHVEVLRSGGRNVPNVEGAITLKGSTRWVPAAALLSTSERATAFRARAGRHL